MTRRDRTGEPIDEDDAATSADTSDDAATRLARDQAIAHIRHVLNRDASESTP